MQIRMKRSLGWVEAGFYLAGVAMLSVFFLLRFEGQRQSDAGIAAFHEAAALQSVNGRVSALSAAPDSRLESAVAAPDQSLWAVQRIRDYEASVQVAGSPPLAVLSIDKVGIEVPVYDGTDEYNLNRGVGRIEGTAAVDAVGNLGIAGHRDSFFRGLKDIAVGDRLELLTTEGKLQYAISSIDIVDPRDVWVLAPTEQRTITLVTCYPFYYVGHAPKRFIVKATAEHLLANH
jgi:sortase A